jgi:hypothetical protein
MLLSMREKGFDLPFHPEDNLQTDKDLKTRQREREVL